MKLTLLLLALLVCYVEADINQGDSFTKDLASSNYKRFEWNTGLDVFYMVLKKQVSKSVCTKDKTFGFSGSMVWVDKGCRGTFEITPVFKRIKDCGSIVHFGGKCIHPLGGSPNPAPGTPIVIHSGCTDDRLLFCRTNKGSLRHLTSGLCIQPSSSKPSANTILVLSENCGASYTKFSFTSGKGIKHMSSGMCWHPKGGSSSPADNTKVVTHPGCDQDRLQFTLNQGSVVLRALKMMNAISEKVKNNYITLKNVNIDLQKQVDVLKTKAGDSVWPSGSYCLLAAGACPTGFCRKEGYIRSIKMYDETPTYIKPVKFGDSVMKKHYVGHKDADLYLAACCTGSAC